MVVIAVREVKAVTGSKGSNSMQVLAVTHVGKSTISGKSR